MTILSKPWKLFYRVVPERMVDEHDKLFHPKAVKGVWTRVARRVQDVEPVFRLP